jgi:hypothetical protein
VDKFVPNSHLTGGKGDGRSRSYHDIRTRPDAPLARMITFMPAVPIRGELGSLYQLYSISKHTFHQTLFLRLRRPVLRLRRLSGLSDRPALLFNFKTTTFIIKGTNSTCTTSQQLQQSGTNYGSREAAIHSFEEDSEFPVYSRRIKSLQRQSLVIAITKLIIENYYYYAGAVLTSSGA